MRAGSDDSDCETVSFTSAIGFGGRTVTARLDGEALAYDVNMPHFTVTSGPYTLLRVLAERLRAERGLRDHCTWPASAATAAGAKVGVLGGCPVFDISNGDDYLTLLDGSRYDSTKGPAG
eukprot:SAG11_NODE_247_length_11679_cov_6.170898_8_plen_120_part_00